MLNAVQQPRAVLGGRDIGHELIGRPRHCYQTSGRVSMRELVRRTGLSPTTIADLYHGRSTRLDLATLDKVCTALGVSVGELLEYRSDADVG